ncbi:Protein kinase domain [Dillenia turbinata]|uniref:Protein kinase domain n=1 Tax=Dillenia turbinata TaxID=194707 RepID=A0AAN8W9R8_9MAGN
MVISVTRSPPSSSKLKPKLKPRIDKSKWAAMVRNRRKIMKLGKKTPTQNMKLGKKSPTQNFLPSKRINSSSVSSESINPVNPYFQIHRKFHQDPDGSEANSLDKLCVGDLANYIEGSDCGLLETQIRVFSRDILMGLDYVHSQGYVHGDVKAENILLAPKPFSFLDPSSSFFNCKISDFGLVQRCVHGIIDKVTGTPGYLGPETEKDHVRGFPLDIWAFGCVVLEMMTGVRLSSDECISSLVFARGHKDPTSNPNGRGQVVALGLHPHTRQLGVPPACAGPAAAICACSV